MGKAWFGSWGLNVANKDGCHSWSASHSISAPFCGMIWLCVLWNRQNGSNKTTCSHVVVLLLHWCQTVRHPIFIESVYWSARPFSNNYRSVFDPLYSTYNGNGCSAPWWSVCKMLVLHCYILSAQDTTNGSASKHPFVEWLAKLAVNMAIVARHCFSFPMCKWAVWTGSWTRGLGRMGWQGGFDAVCTNGLWLHFVCCNVLFLHLWFLSLPLARLTTLSKLCTRNGILTQPGFLCPPPSPVASSWPSSAPFCWCSQRCWRSASTWLGDGDGCGRVCSEKAGEQDPWQCFVRRVQCVL